MAPRVKVFIDTSALFAGIWSAEGGGRLLLHLGENHSIQLLVSSQVLTEIEDVIRGKAPETLARLALLLEYSGVIVAPPPSQGTLEKCQALVNYPGDALVIASAWESHVDYFVTLDRKYFLNNLALRNILPFPIGTPGDVIAWLKAGWRSEIHGG
jgi:predicted nucleic acid-binding protein